MPLLHPKLLFSYLISLSQNFSPHGSPHILEREQLKLQNWEYKVHKTKQLYKLTILVTASSSG